MKKFDYPLYVPGQKLGIDEYVLKVRDSGDEEPPTGFLAKLSKKHEIMKSFDNWGVHWDYTTKTPKLSDSLPIYVFKETYRTGWKIEDWRFGMSQNWATMVHPEGWTVEIYLHQFLEIVKTFSVVHGTIIGEFKWEDKTLKWK